MNEIEKLAKELYVRDRTSRKGRCDSNKNVAKWAMNTATEFFEAIHTPEKESAPKQIFYSGKNHYFYGKPVTILDNNDGEYIRVQFESGFVGSVHRDNIRQEGDT